MAISRFKRSHMYTVWTI